jgi:thiamine-monophosphate kinase
VSSELARVALLRDLFGGDGHAHVRVGIGDDAAVIEPPRDPLVWTVDASVEGVHFDRAWLSLEDVGYRATMAAASDLAAMGARPLSLLAALVLPSWVRDADLTALARGQRLAADELGTVIAGGNLARGSELSVTTTAIGAASRPLPRGGGRPGDLVWIAGPVGLAAAGLAALMAGRTSGDAAIDAAIHAWRRPRARLREGLVAARVASAAIDVSDGLARDLGHVARASGVSVVLDDAAVVSPELEAAASLLGRVALDLALHGGEDYALVVVAPREAELEGFVRIGEIEAGEPSVWLRADNGRRERVDERGFDHFAGSGEGRDGVGAATA